MMNTTVKPIWFSKPYRRPANANRIGHLKFIFAAASILFASLSGPVLAAPDCSAYIPAINKQLAS